MLSVVSAGAAPPQPTAVVGMPGGADQYRGARHHHHLRRARRPPAQPPAPPAPAAAPPPPDLPPALRMPDGEEAALRPAAACHHRLQIRDADQESEIYQKCVRPPPNRTVHESESPPPYRSCSAGALSSSSDWSTGGSAAPLVAPPSQTQTQKTDLFQRTAKMFGVGLPRRPPPGGGGGA